MTPDEEEEEWLSPGSEEWDCGGMTLTLISHPAMSLHHPGGQPGHGPHPERPERLAAVLAALETSGLDLDRRPASRVGRADLERVHASAYLDGLDRLDGGGTGVSLDADTRLGPGSLDAARLAAGAVVDAVRGVAAGEFERAFCAVRPPGHHAEPNRAMGFCFYSSVAVGARAAQAAGFARVGVLDFDVHHGNGTQAAFESDPTLFLASVHQSPLYPGTGAEEERGVGNICNAPVPPLAPIPVWRRRFEACLEALDAFAPDLILISAGFDAHRQDPLAQQQLEAEDFAWATRAALTVARRTSKGRIVSSLEGGYDLDALGRSARAHAQALEEG